MDQTVIELQATDSPESAAGKIQPQPASVILMLGSFDDAFQPKVRSILSRAVAPLALGSGSLIIDNGGASGASAAMALAAEDQDKPPRMLAIVSQAAKDLDPNHLLVMRLPAAWTDAAKYMCQITAQLVKGPEESEKPVLSILFGGKDADLPTLLQCARRQWPILVAAGSGGLADQIVKASAKPAEGQQPEPIADPALAEVVAAPGLGQFPIVGGIESLQRVLTAHLEIQERTLADAWGRFDDLDQAANQKQAWFRAVQFAILLLGVTATLLAILITAPFPESMTQTIDLIKGMKSPIHYLMILVPITISILVAGNNRFRSGNKWILLRSAAESIKQEIFRYRAQAGAYSTQQAGEISPESRLAAKIKDVTSSLSQSEVNKTNVPHVTEADQGRLTFLTPEQYLVDRVEDQIGYMGGGTAKYEIGKTQKLERQLKKNQIWIYLFGGAGTLLAAISWEPWVALTTAIATALTTKLESEQVENSLVQYNQALMALQNIRTWWNALSKWEKGRRTNIDLLVEQTEQTMEFELKGWTQQMQSALDKLTEKENADQKPKA